MLAATTLAFAGKKNKDADFHLDLEPARALYQASAFLHGYLHGYQQGFHCADQDIHMGRPPRPLEKLEHPGSKEYRPRFGDRQLFLRGFKAGLSVGYADGMRGSEFRAIAQGRMLARELEVTDLLPPAQRKLFEVGVAHGYESGLRQGLLDARTQSPYPADLARTASHISGPLSGPDHKLGFTLGYRLGYDDGYLNQSSGAADEKFAARK